MLKFSPVRHKGLNGVGVLFIAGWLYTGLSPELVDKLDRCMTRHASRAPA